jgi:hypothetical protein
MRTWLRLCFITTLWGLSSVAWGTQILLNNAQFANLPAGGLNYSNQDGSASVGAIAGWTETGSGGMGQYDPSSLVFNSLPETTVAYSNGGIISQDATTVQANEVYTLTVQLGDRIGLPETGSIDLLVNGVTYQGVGTTPTPGNWSTYTVTYTAINPDVGAQIYIQLASSGAQADFADVELSEVDPPDGVPEPGSMALCCCGLAAIGTRWRLSQLVEKPEQDAGQHD